MLSNQQPQKYRNNMTLKDSLLVGLHVKADFVPRVQMDVALHIIRGVGQVEHFLRTVRRESF